ncbi:MAG: hypothetical protein WCJ73_07935, partial [Actinomycetes bacterium]
SGLSAIGVFLLLFMSSGSLGTMNLAQLGPRPALGGVIALALMLIGAIPTALLFGIRSRKTRPAPRPTESEVDELPDTVE